MTPAEFFAARESLGLTQQALADHLGRSRSIVQQWEHGRQPVDTLAARYMAALLAGNPKVKPLEWVEIESDRGDGSSDLTGDHEAVSVVGNYLIEIGFESDSYYWGVSLDGEQIGRRFEDLTYAQAAAQTHYEARILSALLAGYRPDDWPT